MEDQPQQESRLNVVAQQVTRSTADEKPPPADAVESDETSGASLSSGAIAQSQARPVAAPIQNAAPQNPQAQTAVSQTPLVQAQPATALQDRAAPATATTPAPAPATPLTPTPAATKAMDPATESAVPSEIAALSLASDRPSTTPTAETQPRLSPSASLAPPSIATAEKEPDVLATKAVLAFPGEAGNVDPKSLAAFQSFTQPGSASATDLRDGLSAALSLPCARMQVIFDPEDATLRLTGHVPDNDMRAPLLDSLRGRLGTDIAIADDLLILPAPQCTALTGIANVGLPQSTDQITNPLIVGEDTHARAFRYSEGDALVLDMVGADYPAYVYVDYFDAAGNVIHLTPNDRAPLQRVDAKAPLQIGARRADEPGLFVRIGPPYGQEIAAAFAASVPLYQGLRPLVEPADAYLQWMQQRVAEARAENPDFKGEWVYFFVTTAPQ